MMRLRFEIKYNDFEVSNIRSIYFDSNYNESASDRFFSYNVTDFFTLCGLPLLIFKLMPLLLMCVCVRNVGAHDIFWSNNYYFWSSPGKIDHLSFSYICSGGIQTIRSSIFIIAAQTHCMGLRTNTTQFYCISVFWKQLLRRAIRTHRETGWTSENCGTGWE